FFCQAEDGIRAGHVTGVQTCALPIYRLPALPRVFWTSAWRDAPDERSYPLLAEAAHGALAVLPEPLAQPSGPPLAPVAADRIERSEERRVGKGCGCRRCAST